MQDPSLVVVPYRYKSAKLYSEIPITGVGDFTVGRLLNTATRVNSNGNIEVVNANIPRLDYYTSGGTAGCPALLVEPSAANNCFQSQGLSTSPWIAGGVTVTGTTQTNSPDGTQNAFDITIANTGFSALRQFIACANNTTYTVSCFYKNKTLVTGETFEMRYTNENLVPNNLNAIATIDLAAGTATYLLAGTSGTGFSGTATGRIENYGNGWYRVSMTFTVGSAGANVNGIFRPIAGVSISRNFYAWGAQLETGSVATSYIPTTTGSVTRNADVISLTGVSGLIGQSEGTLYAEVVLSRVNPNQVISLGTPGASNDRIMIFFDSSTGISALIRVGASNVDYNVTIPAIPATGGVYKIALAYKANDYCFAVNGVAYPSTASRGVPANMSAVYLGASVFSTGQLNDRIRAAALYNSRLDDADLMVLTSPTYYRNVRDMIWDTFVARTSTFSELPGCLQTRHNELITL